MPGEAALEENLEAGQGVLLPSWTLSHGLHFSPCIWVAYFLLII